MWEKRRKKYEDLEKTMGQQIKFPGINNLAYNASRIEELSRCIMDLEVMIAKGKK